MLREHMIDLLRSSWNRGNEMDEPTKKTIEAYDKGAEKYAKKWFKFIDILEDHLDFFIKNLNGKKILDLGCGPGRDSKYFSEKGFEVIGIDLSDKFLKMAAKNAPKAKFMRMDMRKLDFPDNYFDGVWACASIFHIERKYLDKLLNDLRRILKEDGIFYMTTKLEDYTPEEEKIVVLYSSEEIKDKITSKGYKIIKTFENKTPGAHWIVIFAINQQYREK